jgi:rhodanese-related sulfurtransferase
MPDIFIFKNPHRMNHTLVTILLTALFLVLLAVLYYNTQSPLAMYPEEAKARLKKGDFDAVVDVRTKAEWDLGRFPLAIHIPTGDIQEVLPQRVPDKASRILFYCNTSTRSRMAAEVAQKMGYSNVRYLIGTHKNLM